MSSTISTYYEASQATPRAVIGLTDISARFFLRKMLERDILSFKVPWELYRETEENVPGSFLTRFAWKSIMGT